MTIVKWTPLMELDPIERRMRRWLEEFGFAPLVAPPTDIYETEDEYVVELEVPGFDEKELTVEVVDHTLAIKGERVAVKEEEKKEFALHERLAGRFERRFALPVAADTDQVKALFAKGVLEVHAPKAPIAKPRKVTITGK
jgi:HSP20 family protein